MIGILDYGASNLLSVRKALVHIREDCRLISSKGDIKGIDRLVLPGVGAFQSAMEKLNSAGIYKFVEDWLNSDRPFLGICLGMQVLFEESEESKGVKGFGFLKGKVVRFKSQNRSCQARANLSYTSYNCKKVPQIGWNQVRIKRKSKIMDGIEDGSFFYFLHGYYASPKDNKIVVGTTDYGNVYPSVIEKGNVYAVQFHPEKSGDIGLKLLKNWVNKC